MWYKAGSINFVHDDEEEEPQEDDSIRSNNIDRHV